MFELAGLARFDAGEVVAAGAGMGVDDAEGRFFFAKMLQHQGQGGMLDHIGEIPRVIGVTIIHRQDLAVCRSRLKLHPRPQRPGD